MPYFDEGHPLSEFNKDVYIESGKIDERIYIFRFGTLGAQLVLDFYNKDEPLAFIYPLIFSSDLVWDVDTNMHAIVIEGKSLDDILLKVKEGLKELIDYGKRTSENS